MRLHTPLGHVTTRQALQWIMRNYIGKRGVMIQLSVIIQCMFYSSLHMDTSLVLLSRSEGVHIHKDQSKRELLLDALILPLSCLIRVWY